MIHGHISRPKIYCYKGWTFEIHSYCGPWPLRKDGELRKKAERVFWKMWKEFDKLEEEEKKKYLIGGGSYFF